MRRDGFTIQIDPQGRLHYIGGMRGINGWHTFAWTAGTMRDARKVVAQEIGNSIDLMVRGTTWLDHQNLGASMEWLSWGLRGLREVYAACPTCGASPMTLTFAGGDREGECEQCATAREAEIDRAEENRGEN